MTILKKIREIVLDTETTGLSCENGDRIVEIGCIELINHIPTENNYHVYINPGKPMEKKVVEITGITDEFLKDKPQFNEIADDFLKFVDGGTLVIHNAVFDIGFLNCELQRLNKPLFNLDDAIDTLAMAHQKFPGATASLDALCRRFSINTSIREKHGALIDCALLAEVYIQLLGGKQSGLEFSCSNEGLEKFVGYSKQNRPMRIFKPSEEEIVEHAKFLSTINNPVWNKIM